MAKFLYFCTANYFTQVAELVMTHLQEVFRNKIKMIEVWPSERPITFTLYNVYNEIFSGPTLSHVTKLHFFLLTYLAIIFDD